MQSQIDQEAITDVSNWITSQANKLKVKIFIFTNGITCYDDWLHVPVWLESFDGDAYDRASMLQKIEDRWDATKHNGMHLMLIPGTCPNEQS